MLNTQQKALRLNLEKYIYGTFSEIGAGQEVARNFFQASGASGMMAKTMSAYDMIISDTIYGHARSGRYVSEDRVSTMLDREFQLLSDRLYGKRSDLTCYFVFANTVAAKSYHKDGKCHGWLGVQFQIKPHTPPSRLIIHIQMLDRENIQQQEAIGRIGVNMLYACYFDLDQSDTFIQHLMDDLSTDRIEIDMIRIEGDAFKGKDERLLSLELVKKKFCKMILFDKKGKVLHATDALYKKNLCILRGSWRPPTLVNIDMIESGVRKFKMILNEKEKESMFILPEISMNKLLSRGEISKKDFLARVDLISQIGHSVLISNCESFASLRISLLNCSHEKTAFILGILNLEEIFAEENHGNLLSQIGDLLKQNTYLYIYPSGRGAADINISSRLQHLLKYLLENHLIEDICDYRSGISHIWSRKVLSMIQNDEENWEEMVPEKVASFINKNKIFI